MKTIKMLRNIEELTSIILTFYCPDMYTEYKSEVRSFFRHCLHVADTRGIPFMVKYVKSTRLAVTRYISGYPLHVTEDVALDKSG